MWAFAKTAKNVVTFVRARLSSRAKNLRFGASSASGVMA
jgi:hypothetical protein